MRIALDTSVAIYSQPIGHSAEHAEQLRDATSLLALAEPGTAPKPSKGALHAFAIAMPTLSELLVKIPPGKRAEVADLLAAGFELLEFDRGAAVEAAAMFAHRPKGPRQVVKVDMQIVACALRWGVDGFCTYDPDQADRMRRAAPTLKIGPPSVFLEGTPVPLFPGR